MRILDSRRLTGPNLHTRTPAAIAEVELEQGEDVDAAIAAWRAELARILAPLDWPCDPIVRVFADRRGLALAFPARFDLLYTATEIVEWTVASATDVLAGREPLPLAPALANFEAAIEREARPDLVRLAAAAEAHGVPLLVDEEGVTLGLGEHSDTWPADSPPRADDVPWSELGRIPVVAITGTNGKTTCARLLARILRDAGRRTGNTSTDGIAIDGAIVEAGDCTGPGAARRLLRHRELQAAVLEAARGGLLRRGFVLPTCDAALLTNVGTDHLGEWGIQTVDELAAAKAIVADIVPAGGRVVLNADNPPIVRLRGRFVADEVWFTLEEDNALVHEHVAKGGEAWWTTRDGELVRACGSIRESFGPARELPLAFGGAARHGIANVLGVCALAIGLGIDPAVVRASIRAFGRDVTDNPGRFERYERGGVAILLDFAHNVDAIRLQREVVAAIRATRPAGHRLIVSFGMAGDRSDAVLAALAAEIAALGPDRVVLREEENYLRGRQRGEVPAVLRAAFAHCGIAEAAIDEAIDERAAIARALAWARPGDVLVVFTHTERAPVLPPE